MASVDILYIDITRRWSGATPDSREAGNAILTNAQQIITKGRNMWRTESTGVLETLLKYCAWR